MEKNKMEEKIKNALGKIRPSLQADGGDVSFEGWDEKTKAVKVKLHGMCVGCPMSQITLKQGIEEEIKKEVPGIKSVEQV